ncbi:unnamed protein product [Cuscuta epithymum]|uniref:Transmembrane protein 131-like N-terminal domain-containing protein n=3 Tax=Cuscuta epithymum TaxID=186058 RepID=A0AAV0C290_9ASTE|nr:unnamed protein product [Cuscuta epithymum]
MESFFFLNMTTLMKTHLSLWGVFHLGIVLYTLLIVANCEPCLVAGNGADYDVRSELTQKVSVPLPSISSACLNPNLLCFPSTLTGLLSKQDSSARIPSETRKSDSGVFRVLDGRRSISCSLNYDNFKRKLVDDTIGLKITDSFLPYIEVRPHGLDWGENYLFFPSLASLMVRNTHRQKTLVVFEPYSTNPQFSKCNNVSSEVVLGPGETSLVCFVFLPTSLGLSSGHLVLQTNYGGFMVTAQGFAVDSPYGIPPVSLSGKGSKKFTLFNPFNEALYVEEVISWVSLGNTSNLTKTVCSIINSNEEGCSLSLEEWLNDTNGEVSLRPRGDWVVGPGKSEPIMEFDFSLDFKGMFFGAFSMNLLRSPQKKIDTVVIPLEMEITKNSGFVSLSISVFTPCSYSGTTVLSLFVHNDSPHVLRVVKIIEEGDNGQRFQIKYIEGLILFPHTVTQVALVSYSLLASTSTEIRVSCKIAVYTNDSSDSWAGIPCTDVFSICALEDLEFSVPPGQACDEEGESVNVKASSLGYNNLQELIVAEAEEAILMNWKSQATASDMSVLDKPEVIFPVIEVGHFCSDWITVKNPSQKPVLMQLILNSAEIIDECGAPEMHLQGASQSHSLMGTNNSITPTRYGFSMDKNAVSEALVHSLGVASLGPVWFRPGSQCSWKTSILIRNNLSGLEWVSVSGIGGSLLMVLVQEDSEPIQNLEFKMSSQSSFNSSFPSTLEGDGKSSTGCSQVLTREVYAKNIGNLPLKVIKIGISGTECQLDGFSVNSCKGFSLSPGETQKIVISYQSDFSLATIQRDLELSLSNGILVIPMKAALPLYFISICKRTFSERLRMSLLPIFLVSSLLFLFRTYLIRKPQDFYIPKSGNGYSRSRKAAKCPTVGQEKETVVWEPQKKIVYSESLDTREPPQVGHNNLTVKVGNEKGRRKRKKKGSSSGGLNALLDVSNSGNSTPSSSSPGPQSPVCNRILSEPIHNREELHEKEASLKLRNDKPAITATTITTQKKNLDDNTPDTVPLNGGMPVSYAESIVVSPPSRAPGSGLRAREGVKSGETKGWGERFVVYDIWGDHLFGGHPVTKDVLPKTAPVVENNSSDSFFVMGPQILMTNNSKQKVVTDHDG